MTAFVPCPAERCHDVFIVGGGPAGLSAGIYAARSGLSVVCAERALPGGQIAQSESIENYPVVKQTTGIELGEALRDHAESAGCQFVYDSVVRIDRLDSGVFDVTLDGGDTHRCGALIYAAGASPRRAGFQGEERYTGRGVSYCATCDGPLYRGKTVYVIGGGTSACEEALFLARMVDRVVMVVRRDALASVASVRAAVLAAANIEVRYRSVVDAVEGGERAVARIVLRNLDTGATEACDYQEGGFGVFVFVGHDPNCGLVEHLVDIVGGAVVTDEHMRTRTPGLFAAGDVRTTALRQVITAASDGAVAAMSAYRYLESLA